MKAKKKILPPEIKLPKDIRKSIDIPDIVFLKIEKEAEKKRTTTKSIIENIVIGHYS